MFGCYKDLEKYDEYRQGEPAFSWLPEFDKWASKHFGVKLMPSYVNIIEQKNPKRILYNIELMAFDRADTDKMRADWKNYFDEINTLETVQNKAMELAQKYNDPILNAGDKVRVLRLNTYKYIYLITYLYGKKPFELKNEIKAFFSHLSPVYFSPENPVICVFETKEEARNFLLSDEYNKIRKQIFDLLKPYDDYDVLKESDIMIFADYKENKERIPMYSRWVRDLGQKEWDEHFESIING